MALSTELLDRLYQCFTTDGSGNAALRVVSSGLSADSVNDTHIDWGTGANQVSAADMPIADSGAYFATDTVEAALQELGPLLAVTSAPASATYITQVPSGGLSAEQALSALATGILKNTTATGVLSIAVAGTDYYAPGSTDVAVADGGTGASSASGARTALGLAIGSDVQAWDADLDAIAALSSADGNFIVGSAAGWVAESGNTARTSLGLGTGDSPTFAGLTLSSALAVAQGGTGATTAANARTNLGAAAASDLSGLISDLASTANGDGADMIGIEDAGGYFTGTTVEDALQELAQGATTGHLTLWPTHFIPTGYLAADGSAVSRSTYSDLFAVVSPLIGNVTLTIASPAVFTKVGHGLQAGDAVFLSTTGTLPGFSESIAFDAEANTSAGSTTSLSWNHTCTGTSRALYILIALNSSTDHVTAVTYGGVAMTRIGTQTNGATRAYLYGLLNPASGTNSCVVTRTAGSSTWCRSLSYTGVNQSSLYDVVTLGTGSGTSISITNTSTVDNCWTIMAASESSETGFSAGSGTTMRGSSSTVGSFDSNGPKTPAGAVTLIGTTAGSSTKSGVAASFAPNTVASIANTIYYVLATDLTADTFKLSALPGGTALSLTGSQSGTHSLYHCPHGLGDGSTTFNLPDLDNVSNCRYVIKT